MVAGGVTWRDRLAVVIGLATLFIVWQAATMLFAVPDYILPRPLDIAWAIVERREQIWRALLFTLAETGAGFAIGALIGIGLAVCLVLIPPCEAVVMPLAVAINAVPSVAFVPLALIWFGLGMGSKIAMAVLAIAFIVLLNALSGLKKPEQGHIDLMRSFGAGRFGILWRLRLPAAMPSIVTGLRVGLGRSTIAVIVAEMLGAYDGIGQIVYQSTAQVDYLSVWAAVLTAMLGSLALYGCLVAIDRKLIWWR
ncbi:MAG: ssuC 12 [Proteobacteria bacterium]|nr:ssuC 12 [Pseudomonadota bacterium]